jgi:hypothetical protein
MPSVRALKEALDSEGIVTKRAATRTGVRGGQPFGRGGLFHMLSNPVYIGKTRHRDKIYDGEHGAVVPQELWDAVQHKLEHQSADRAATGMGKAFLTGLIRDEHGRPMSPTHATKKIRRYYYYASNLAGDTNAGKSANECPPVIRVAQKAIHEAVRHALAELFSQRSVLDLLADHGKHMTILQGAMERSAELRTSITGTRHVAIATLLRKLRFALIVSNDGVSATIDRTIVLGMLLGQRPTHDDDEEPMALPLPIVAANRGKVRRLVLDGSVRRQTEPDPRLVRLLVNGHVEWQRAFAPGNPRPNAHQVRLARLATLAPDITAAILEGRQPAALTSRMMLRLPELPHDWAEQRRMLGFRNRHDDDGDPPGVGMRESPSAVPTGISAHG